MREFLPSCGRDRRRERGGVRGRDRQTIRPGPSPLSSAPRCRIRQARALVEHGAAAVRHAALSTQIPDIEQAVVEAHEYLTALVEDRRATPGPDLISTLLAAEGRVTGCPTTSA